MSYYWLNDGGDVDPDDPVATCYYTPGTLVSPDYEDEIMEYTPGPPVLVKEASGGFDAEYEDGGDAKRCGGVTLFLDSLRWDEARGVYVATYRKDGQVEKTGEFRVEPPARKRQN